MGVLQKSFQTKIHQNIVFSYHKNLNNLESFREHVSKSIKNLCMLVCF